MIVVEPCSQLTCHSLPRGGKVVETSMGPIQFGVPPETIKDTLVMAVGVPQTFVITAELFDYERGTSLVEIEFPTFYNFFFKRRRVIIVATHEQRARLIQLMREALEGPSTYDLSGELPDRQEACPWAPDLEAEVHSFRQRSDGSGDALSINTMVEFVCFDDDGIARLGEINISRGPGGVFEVQDQDRGRCTVDMSMSMGHVADLAFARGLIDFSPPDFGLTMLGSGHGFAPTEKTTGFILWIGGRGILVDPPIDTTFWLHERGISPRRVSSILLTHCHADHDAGTLQRALESEKVSIISTPTIFESFIRKSAAITGLHLDQLRRIIDFIPVRIGTKTRLFGATFQFHYTLHSIPTIRFETWFGGKSLVYSSDTLYDAVTIERLHDEGVMSRERADALLNFPWEHDLIVHEAGVPPIHTPPERFLDLPEATKTKTWLVHTDREAIPSGSGLKRAEPGLEHTLRLEVTLPPTAKLLSWLDAFQTIEHFRHLPMHKALEVIETCEALSVKAGETLIRTGDPGDRFYIILRGRCQVLEGEVPTKLLGEYEYFGERSIVNDTPRSATVVAATHVELLYMNRFDYLRFVRETGIIEHMQRLAANRDARTWRLFDKHPVLRTLSSPLRTRLQAIMHREVHPEGTLLVRSDDNEAAAFLVSGGCLTTRCLDGERTHYGEGTLVTYVDAIIKREASGEAVRVTSDAVVYRLEYEGFREFLLDNPGLYLRLLHRGH